MGMVRPIDDEKPVELIFRGSVSAEYLTEAIDASGLQPSAEWEFVFDLASVDDADLRRRLRVAYERYMAVDPYPELPRPEDDPTRFLAALEPWLDEAEAEQAADAESSSAFNAEMKSWIKEHGSQRLKLASKGDYRSNRSYAVERATQEMPGFWVDSAEDCEWGERVDPTEEMLVLEASVRRHLKGVGPELETRIVWLTDTPRALDQKIEALELEFEAQEALVVPEYLGRYLLVMPSDEALRRDPEDGI